MFIITGAGVSVNMIPDDFSLDYGFICLWVSAGLLFVIFIMALVQVGIQVSLVFEDILNYARKKIFKLGQNEMTFCNFMFMLLCFLIIQTSLLNLLFYVL